MHIWDGLTFLAVAVTATQNLCEERQCIPPDYNRHQSPKESPTVYVVRTSMLPYSLTDVNDKKFVLTLIATLYLCWEDSRINFDNFTSAELEYDVGPSLVGKTWVPDVFMSNLKSTQSVHFIKQENSSKILKKRVYCLLGVSGFF